MEWHPVFKVGRARISVSFTGGHLGDGCVTPAKFETSDRVVHAVIEKSAAFRSGMIRLASVVKEASDDVEKPVVSAVSHTAASAPRTVVAARTSDSNLFGEETMTFGSWDEAAHYLHKEKGIPMSRLIEPEECEREAGKFGITIQIEKKK